MKKDKVADKEKLNLSTKIFCDKATSHINRAKKSYCKNDYKFRANEAKNVGRDIVYTDPAYHKKIYNIRRLDLS